MRYEVMKKLSGILRDKNYYELIHKFKVKTFHSGDILHHIGDYNDDQKGGLFILEGHVECYNFKEFDLDITNEKQLRKALRQSNIDPDPNL